jgi:hypothetical protein
MLAAADMRIKIRVNSSLDQESYPVMGMLFTFAPGWRTAKFALTQPTMPL